MTAYMLISPKLRRVRFQRDGENVKSIPSHSGAIYGT
jgi:hypothetical protein